MHEKRTEYKRYHIETRPTPNIAIHPQRFNVKIKRLALARLLLKELVHYRGQLDLVLSRPCVYGVFSGPLGGFLPKEKLCVGCLRCMTEHPDVVSIHHNSARKTLGDAYLTFELVETLLAEAETGHIPIRGQGYRGKFGGDGWEGMWTDMSEIVRPTRDGIHGREFISTSVDLGGTALFFEPSSTVDPPRSIPIPLIFDIAPAHAPVTVALSEAARQLHTFAFLPIEQILKLKLKGPHLIPFISKSDRQQLQTLDFALRFIEIDALWDTMPAVECILRTDFDDENLLSYYQKGIRIFHLVANYHGRSRKGDFILELIRRAHQQFVQAGCRDAVTLIGSGGIIASEHVPKAILCGLDAVGIDTAAMVALQGRLMGDCSERHVAQFKFPSAFTSEWGTQRLKNLVASWRDQLLEILGAMGLREVRRLRGELGRALFQQELEREAFTGIEGYGAE